MHSGLALFLQCPHLSLLCRQCFCYTMKWDFFSKELRFPSELKSEAHFSKEKDISFSLNYYYTKYWHKLLSVTISLPGRSQFLQTGSLASLLLMPPARLLASCLQQREHELALLNNNHMLTWYTTCIYIYILWWTLSHSFRRTKAHRNIMYVHYPS